MQIVKEEIKLLIRQITTKSLSNLYFSNKNNNINNEIQWFIEYTKISEILGKYPIFGGGNIYEQADSENVNATFSEI